MYKRDKLIVGALEFKIEGPHFYNNLVFWEASVQRGKVIGRICLLFREDEKSAFVGTVLVYPPYQRNRVSTTLHDKAFEWAISQGFKFESGYIQTEENLRYWKKLENEGHAKQIDKDHYLRIS